MTSLSLLLLSDLAVLPLMVMEELRLIPAYIRLITSLSDRDYAFTLAQGRETFTRDEHSVVKVQFMLYQASSPLTLN